MNINPLSTNSPFYSLGGIQAKSSHSQAKFSLPGTEPETPEDSTEAVSMNEAAGGAGLSSLMDGFMDGAGEDGVITLEEISAFGEKYREKADQVLDETLNALGIPANTKINIRTDEQGRVRVEADLPESTREKLEQALNDHPDFQQHFTKASSSYSMVKAAERHLEFAKAYERNPQAAVALFGLGSPPPDFIMEYFNGDTRMVETAV